MSKKTLAALEVATMRLWNSRRAYLQRAPHGIDCEGEFWILRNRSAMKVWRAACRAHAKSTKGKRNVKKD